MAEVFISYARSTASQASAAARALRVAGYSVWLDEDLPAHRPFAREIEAQLTASKAALVIWSAEAVESEWVQSEADRARADRKLVQLRIDGAKIPMPFDRIHCADLAGWNGDASHPGWKKVVASIAELAAGAPLAPQVAVAQSALPAALPLPDKPSIAVLPFTDPAGATDGDYFADGMVEEIVAALTRFSSLFVIAGRSGLSYRGDTRPPREIAAELGVRYLLDGSIRRLGGRLRIAVSLVDAIEGAQVWADRFDGEMEDMFDLQERVAAAVASRIAPSIRAADIRRVTSRPATNLTAYDFYLRALHREAQFDPEAPADTIALVEQALAIDPGYAPALAMKSLMYSALWILADSADEAGDRAAALDAGRKALAAAPDDPEVVGIVSNVLLWTLDDVPGAISLAQRAIEANPDDGFPWWCSAHVQLFTGHPDLAIDYFDRYLRWDPRGFYRPFVSSSRALALAMLRRFDEVEGPAREAMNLLPNHAPAPLGLSAALGHLGRKAEARVAFANIRTGLTPKLLRLIQDAGHREVIASGLRLAGIDV